MASHGPGHIQAMDSLEEEPAGTLLTRACPGIGITGCKRQLGHYMACLSSRASPGFRLSGWSKVVRSPIVSAASRHALL